MARGTVSTGGLWLDGMDKAALIPVYPDLGQIGRIYRPTPGIVSNLDFIAEERRQGAKTSGCGKSSTFLHFSHRSKGISP
jgi:hypothetical protein